MQYTGDYLNEIAFPLGGIGTGSISLSGIGRLRDWEIFNRPNKGGENGFSFFAVKAVTADGGTDARILQGDMPSPYGGGYGSRLYGGYGFGPDRSTMAGMPHFEQVTFDGEFPIAALQFEDSAFPGRVRMRALNPFIPGNVPDSSIPAAFFELEVENTAKQACCYTLCLTVSNPFRDTERYNAYRTLGDGVHFLEFSSRDLQPDAEGYGQLCIAAWAADGEMSVQPCWYRGEWFDSLSVFWNEFVSKEMFTRREYSGPADHSGTDPGSLAVRVWAQPGQRAVARFLLGWNFPNRSNTWNPPAGPIRDKFGNQIPNRWRNYYAGRFTGVAHTAVYCFREWERLWQETERFHDALFSSTLPAEVLDAVSANLSVLKTPTCMLLEDGSFYAFEGCHCQEGCCEGSCMHVWNYAYALPFLFPSLARSMRVLNYRYNEDTDGALPLRLQLPLGRPYTVNDPCVDGQFGEILNVYREWKLSGDTEWMRSLWPDVKRSLEYAWSPRNGNHWDADCDGILEGRQNNTLDMELFGPNAWLTGFYLAALKAAAELAEAVGEPDTAERYRAILASGQEKVKRLFRGEYFMQEIDLRDPSILELYAAEPERGKLSAMEQYWNAETGEMKYQLGNGCFLDQVAAQWHANCIGLGEILDPQMVRSALASIYRYNYKENFRRHFNPARIFALNDEAGTVLCEWPDAGTRPIVSAPYCEETWTGCEYQAAAHMLQSGLVPEGLALVRAVRSRFDGKKRNPWNEFECGSNYARSMSSYSLLLAISGFRFDLTQGKIGFSPLHLPDGSAKFRCFWSVDGAWGVMSCAAEEVRLEVWMGQIRLRQLELPQYRPYRITSQDAELQFSLQHDTICLSDVLELRQGDVLVVSGRSNYR